MKILAFAASSSKNSINRKLVNYATEIYSSEINQDAEIEILDLNDYEMPIYSIDRENESGMHPLAQKFHDKISNVDALIISFAEHNGHYTVAYKNIFDWASRLEGKVYQDKPSIILSTSPGQGGGASVLGAAIHSAPFFAMNVKGSLSVGSFYDVFDVENNRITDDAINEKLKSTLQNL